MSEPRYGGAEYQVGDAIKGRWLIRSICGGRGRSGMGVVYIVDDLLLSETQAAKTLQPHLVADARVRTLLGREANLWLALGRHPNIVALDYVDAPGTQIYLFMQYVAPDDSGRNCLRHYLTEKPLPDSTIAKWSIEICRALSHMRARGVAVHRDLKPDNVMIDSTGTVRVTDFGLAGAFDGGARPAAGAAVEDLPRSTIIGSVAGTPGYLAPELFDGERADVASDVYSFGLVLAQMTTGNPWPPFTGAWRGDVLAWEAENRRIRESLEAPGADSTFAGVIARCLEFDPKRRFASFDEIEQALGALAGIAGIEVPAPPLLATSTAARTEGGINDVVALYNLGRLQEALERVVHLRASRPDDSALLTCEGTVRADLGDFDRAIPLLSTACALTPQWCGHWNNLGKALRASRRPAPALSAYERAIECDPRHGNTWTSKGNCLYDLGRDVEALAAYEQAASLDARFWATQLGLARTHARLGNPIAALVAFERLFEVEPDNAEARAEHAIALRKLASTPAARDTGTTIAWSNECHRVSRFDEGLAAVREARFRFGPSSALWNNEGVFLIEQGDCREAVRCFDRALEREPDRSDAWSNKGRAYRRMGQPQEALYCHERAIAADPGSSGLWSNRHACHVDLGMHDEARACFRKACELASTPEERATLRAQNDDLYYLTFGDLAFARQDYDETHRCASSIAEGSPLHAEATQMLARARYYIAVEFAEKDLAATGSGFTEVVRVLELALSSLADDDERGAVRQRLDHLLQRYVQASYGKLAQTSNYGLAYALLAAVLRHCASDELKTFATKQIAVICAKTAVAKLDELNRGRAALIERLSG